MGFVGVRMGVVGLGVGVGGRYCDVGVGWSGLCRRMS